MLRRAPYAIALGVLTFIFVLLILALTVALWPHLTLDPTAWALAFGLVVTAFYLFFGENLLR